MTRIQEDQAHAAAGPTPDVVSLGPQRVGADVDRLLDHVRRRNADGSLYSKAAPATPGTEVTATAGGTRLQAIRIALVVMRRRLFSTAADPFDALFDAQLQLDHALELLQMPSVDLDRKQLHSLQPYIDAAHDAIVSARDGFASHERHAHALRQLTAREQHIRLILGMESEPSVSSVDVPHDSSDDNEIEPTLELVRIEASGALDELNANGDRSRIIDRISTPLARHLAYARAMIARQEAKNQIAHRDSVESATSAVVGVFRWIAGRPASAGLLQAIAPLRSDLDLLRVSIGLGPSSDVEVRATLGMFEDERRESGDLAQAMNQFTGALTASKAIYQLGIERFEKLAALRRPVPPRSGFEALAKQLLILGLTNIVTPGVGAFAASFVAAQVSSEKVAEFVNKTAVNGIKDGVTRLFAKKPPAPESNAMIRDRTLFAEGMKIAHVELCKETEASVGRLSAEGKLSAKELRSMSAAVNAAATTISHVAYHEAAHAFALYQARMGLAASDRDMPTDAAAQASAMDGYLDRDSRGVPTKEGTTGVAKLRVTVSQHGRDLRIAFTRFEVHGMNDDMAIAILERAGYHLDRLDLPLEIEMTPPKWGIARAVDKPFLVIDERGSMRASRDWDAIDNALRDASWSPPDDAVWLASPDAFWGILRNAVVPVGVAKIAAGG